MGKLVFGVDCDDSDDSFVLAKFLQFKRQLTDMNGKPMKVSYSKVPSED